MRRCEDEQIESTVLYLTIASEATMQSYSINKIKKY